MTVLITGAASGLGKATSEYFRKRGDAVFAIDLKKIQEEDGLIPFQVDLTKEEEVISLTEKLKNITFDAILNFAGMFFMDDFLEIEEARLKQIFEVNVFAAMRVNRLLFPLLKKDGKIIIVSSEVASLDPLPFNSVYHVTKAALDSYANALRQEAGLLGKKVVIIRPGAFQTPLANSSVPSMKIMVEKSAYFAGQAERFQCIMNRFTGKLNDPSIIGKLAYRITMSNHPRCVYHVRRNIWLVLLNCLPKKWQGRVVRFLVCKK